MNEPSTVVLGVGSVLMGDDGVGVAVVESLRERWQGDPSLGLLDGGTWGMRVLPFIEMADRLLIIDAIKAGGAGGEFVRLEGDAIPRHLHHKLSPHQIELGEVLAVAQLRGLLPKEMVAMGIEPASVELRDGFSSDVEGALPGLVRAIEDQLRAWGHAPVEVDMSAEVPATVEIDATAGRTPAEEMGADA